MKIHLFITAIFTLLSFSMSAVGGVTYSDCIGYGYLLPGDTLWSENGEWVAKFGEDGIFSVLEGTNNWKQNWVAPGKKYETSEILLNRSGLYGRNAETGYYDVFKFEGKPRHSVDTLCMRNDGTLATYWGNWDANAVWESISHYKHYWQSSSNYHISPNREIKVDMQIWKNFGKMEKRSCRPQLVVRDKNGGSVVFELKDRVSVKVKDGKKDVGFNYQLTDDQYHRMHSVQVDCY